MFDLFLSAVVFFSQRLGHFLREGMKPSPAPSKCDQCMNMIFDFIYGIRAGINPTPTVAECCNHFYNPLIAKVLHTSAVGAGFIPALPTADKIKSKCTAAAMMGIKPSSALGKCTIDARICTL